MKDKMMQIISESKSKFSELRTLVEALDDEQSLRAVLGGGGDNPAPPIPPEDL